jgi:hypothetical protein
MTRQDLHALRIPLIALAITLLAAAGTTAYSNALVQDARRHLGQRESQLQQARLRIQNVNAEKDMITRYAAAYQALERSGFSGEERRIDWIDALRSASEQARTFGVEYDIGVQRPYAYDAALAAGPLQLHASHMQLRMRLLHEEDLSRFFDALARTGAGVFHAERCVLRRLEPEDAGRDRRVRPNVAAACDLQWLTARAPAAVKQ